LTRFVPDELKSAYISYSAGMSYERMLCEPAEAVLQHRCIPLNMSENVTLFIKPQRLKRDCGTDRVPSIGEAMSEHAKCGALLIARIPNLLADHHGRYWQISGRQALGAGQDIRLQAIDFAAKHAAEAAEAGDDFVRNEKDVVTLQDFRNSLEIASRRQNDAS